MTNRDIIDYDVIVIGSGTGVEVVNEALARGNSVALVDRGPVGGTCPNTGCVPSKVLTIAADQVREVQEAQRLGVSARIDHLDFRGIMERMRQGVRQSQQRTHQWIGEQERMDFYGEEASFVGPHELQVGQNVIRAKRVFVAAGARPLIPAIPGLDNVGYLTNETALELEALPKSVTIIGGGYVGVEFAHFFSAMGSKVTVLEMAERIVAQEEPEVSCLLQERMSVHMDIRTRVQVERVSRSGVSRQVHATDVDSGEALTFASEQILLGTGRQGNGDILQAERAGMSVDDQGFIQVNERMETGVSGIWATGDINGQQMFLHTGDREAQIAWHNSTNEPKRVIDYTVCPHAVYARPQIASVGLREGQAKQRYDIEVGKAFYRDTDKGQAMQQEHGFAKLIAEKGTRRILGFHVIGPFAPLLLQEVVDVMALHGTVDDITAGLHLHPDICKLTIHAIANLSEQDANG